MFWLSGVNLRPFLKSKPEFFKKNPRCVGLLLRYSLDTLTLDSNSECTRELYKNVFTKITTNTCHSYVMSIDFYGRSHSIWIWHWNMANFGKRTWLLVSLLSYIKILAENNKTVQFLHRYICCGSAFMLFQF